MRLGFTGDLFPGRKLVPGAFREIAEGLERGVKLVVNFEGTLYDRPEQLSPARKKIILTSPVGVLDQVAELPIAACSTGNNHIADYGDDIASFTLDALSLRWPTFGAGTE